MALTPTLYDFDVELNHVDRDIHRKVPIRIARHPSEALERVWLKVLAYCWLYEERIAFGPGLSDPDAPDLVAHDLTGRTTLWVRVGRPDPQKLQREIDRGGGARVVGWFESQPKLAAFLASAAEAKLSRLDRAELIAVDAPLIAALAAVDERRSRFELTVVGDHLYLQRGGQALEGPLLRGAVP
jgi:uncharacterized protein YaeQ